MEIIVFHTAFIGDLLLAIPFFKRIRRQWRDNRITIVCRPGLKNFFLENKIVDEVIELEKGNSQSERATIAALKKKNISLLFCPHQSFRSAWMLKSIRAQKKIAYRTWWNFLFFNTRVERPMQQPEALRVLALLAPLGAVGQLPAMPNLGEQNTVVKWPNKIAEEFSMVVSAPAEAVQESLRRSGVKKPFVVISPSSQWATKRWTPDGYIDLGKKILAQKLNVYVVGSDLEVPECQIIVDGIGREAGVEAKNLAGHLDLLQLHRVMSAANYVVANDSGAMHMAAVAGTPVAAIFGPTVLSLGYRPWANNSVVVQKGLDCRPCGKHGHVKCPLGTHDCMKKISASDVMSAAHQLL